MAHPSRRVKHVLKYGAIHRLLDLGKLVPAERVGSAASTIGSILYSILPLRRKVQSNMELALGRENVPADAAREYFSKLGTWTAYAAQGYHRGLVDSGITDWMIFDDSVSILEDALSGGKGVIYAVPHLMAHEFSAGILARKYPTVGLVRESKYAPHNRVKEKYYLTSGGCNVIFRPRRGSVASDMRICTRSLKEGNILVVTPDLLVGPGEGVGVDLLGRSIALRPGIVSLAMVTGAPVVNAFLHWESEHLVVRCHEPRFYSRDGDRQHTMVSGMQTWCDTFSEYLGKYPGNWMFWLDRNWTRVWQTSEAGQ